MRLIDAIHVAIAVLCILVVLVAIHSARRRVTCELCGAKVHPDDMQGTRVCLVCWYSKDEAVADRALEMYLEEQP